MVDEKRKRKQPVAGRTLILPPRRRVITPACIAATFADGFDIPPIPSPIGGGDNGAPDWVIAPFGPGSHTLGGGRILSTNGGPDSGADYTRAAPLMIPPPYSVQFKTEIAVGFDMDADIIIVTAGDGGAGIFRFVKTGGSNVIEVGTTPVPPAAALILRTAPLTPAFFEGIHVWHFSTDGTVPGTLLFRDGVPVTLTFFGTGGGAPAGLFIELDMASAPFPGPGTPSIAVHYLAINAGIDAPATQYCSVVTGNPLT